MPTIDIKQSLENARAELARIRSDQDQLVADAKAAFQAKPDSSTAEVMVKAERVAAALVENAQQKVDGFAADLAAAERVELEQKLEVLLASVSHDAKVEFISPLKTRAKAAISELADVYMEILRISGEFTEKRQAILEIERQLGLPETHTNTFNFEQPATRACKVDARRELIYEGAEPVSRQRHYAVAWACGEAH